MKSFAVATLLALLLVFNLSSAADVAELRRLRALGTSSGHHFGGDNGRDHPGNYNNNAAATTPAPVAPEVSQEQEDTVASSAAAPASLEAEIVAMESGSSGYTGCQIAYIVFGVMAGVLVLFGIVFFFFSQQETVMATNNSSAQTVAKGVPVAVPTREQDEETLEDMSSGSDSA